jgi:glyoxylase-like metal-dependent hydrolase (beta-lactamase superfamily II)
LRIGEYELHAVETGRFALDGGALYGVVPRTLWEKSSPPDAMNRVHLSARALLLIGVNRVVLIDTGNGSKFDEKLKRIYKIDDNLTDLFRSLKALGIGPDDVTDVILTHLHFDHAGGATTIVDGRCVPAFPRARHYVQREHWEAAHRPTERDRASYFAHDFEPLHDRGMLTLIEGEGEVLPGVRVMTFHGHTAALQCPVISDGTSTIFYCADLVPLASHLQLPWIMAYDLRPLVTLEEKRSLLKQAVDEKWVLFYEHDPEIIASTVKSAEKGYAVDVRLDL